MQTKDLQPKPNSHRNIVGHRVLHRVVTSLLDTVSMEESVYISRYETSTHAPFIPGRLMAVVDFVSLLRAWLVDEMGFYSTPVDGSVQSNWCSRVYLELRCL